MNIQKIGSFGRALVCLFLVFCFLVNASPIRARAVDPISATVVGVGAAIVVTSVIVGLGVLPGLDPEPFNILVNDCIEFLSSAGSGVSYVLDGLIDVFCMSTGSVKYAVDQSLIETIRAWLFEEEIIYYSPSDFVASLVQLKAGPYSRTLDQDIAFMESEYDDACDYSTAWKYCLLYYYDHPTLSSYDGYNCYFLYSYPTTTISSGTTYYELPAGTYYYEKGLPSYAGIRDYDFTCSYSAYSLYSFSPSAVAADSLGAGEIATSDLSLDVGYSDWASNAVAVPLADSTVTAFPLGLDNTYEETRDKDQAAVWLGSSTLVLEGVTDKEDTVPDETTDVVAPADGIAGTVTNIWEFIQSLPQAIGGAIKGVLTAVFIPSEGFVVELVQALAADYPLFGSSLDLIDTCLDALDVGSTTVPVIYIDLSAGKGSFDWGQKTVLMDLSWYEDYKPSVDAIMSAFLWAVFVFKLITKAPGIIAGIPGEWIMDGLGHAGLIDYLPTRNMAYEVHRADLRSQVRAGPSASDEAIDRAFVEGYNEAVSDIFLED